ncbi:PadR family transcriptional regulator PadR [Rhizomicrobium palustre]|uniref:PadR family transcriptional regulator PadR n=1 Tax=Rhizomicrobium palustre TaxID=189966 RepID=A0A846N1C0_9PROT|nr:PadR family transcriptional regulator [Rhizomicrobium palustre]NIK89383.1 PadR family transcriptional regulator PadR [Rhizomicrobium palustre]
MIDIAPWLSQLRKGAAELVVLSVVARGECYGLQILTEANRQGDIVADGALYPLLNRLEKDGKLMARWVTDDAAHPRKYYSLTAEGEKTIAAMKEAWIAFRTAMTGVVENTP